MSHIDKLFAMIKEVDAALPDLTDEQWAEANEQHRLRQLRAEMEPMPVTECHTCEEVSLMWRLGCPAHDCPGQPASVNVSHMLATTNGFLLRPGEDFMWLEDKPTT